MRFRFYTSTEEAWKAMLSAIEKAQKSIHIEQYILTTDTIGLQFISLLREKARGNVEVKIVADTAGSHSLWLSPLVEEMCHDGIEIIFFNPYIIGARGHYSPWFFRDHSKLMIIDKCIGFTGGICIKDLMRTWRDTHVEIEGRVVEQMEKAFERMWRYAHKKIPTISFPRRRSHQSRQTSNTEYIMSLPLPTKRHLYYRLIDAIRNAQKTIYLTTPYFVPDRRLFRVLILAAQRGVSVNILLPFLADHWYMDYAAESYFNQALKAGIKIYRYKNTMIHAKTGVIDGGWATVGSLNLDTVSLKYNFEANIVSYNKDFAREIEKQFFTDCVYAELVTKSTWEARSIIQKTGNIFIKPFRFIL